MNNCKTSGAPGVIQTRLDFINNIIKLRSDGDPVPMVEEFYPNDIRIACTSCTPDCTNATRWDQTLGQDSLEVEWNANNA